MPKIIKKNNNNGNKIILIQIAGALRLWTIKQYLIMAVISSSLRRVLLIGHWRPSSNVRARCLNWKLASALPCQLSQRGPMFEVYIKPIQQLSNMRSIEDACGSRRHLSRTTGLFNNVIFKLSMTLTYYLVSVVVYINHLVTNKKPSLLYCAFGLILGDTGAVQTTLSNHNRVSSLSQHCWPYFRDNFFSRGQL